MEAGRKGGTSLDVTPTTCPSPLLPSGEKLAIVQKANAGVTVRQVAKEFGVDPKSVRYWQRQKVELEGQVSGSTQKSTHVSAIPAQFEQSLGVWLQMEETRGSNVTYAMIVDKLRVPLCTVVYCQISVIALSLYCHCCYCTSV